MGSYLVGDGSLLVQLGAPLLGAETKAQRELMRQEAHEGRGARGARGPGGVLSRVGAKGRGREKPPVYEGLPKGKRAGSWNERDTKLNPDFSSLISATPESASYF